MNPPNGWDTIKNYFIGMLHLSIRELKKESVEELSAFEEAIGVQGYQRLLEEQGTILVLAGLIQCSSGKMQGELSELLRVNPELVKRFFGFIRDMVPSEEWLKWIRQGATLEGAILISSGLIPRSFAA